MTCFMADIAPLWMSNSMSVNTLRILMSNTISMPNDDRIV